MLIFQVEKASENTLLKRPMFIHSLDISTVPHGYVTWRAPNLTDVYGEVAGETQYYSLTEGSYIQWTNMYRVIIVIKCMLGGKPANSTKLFASCGIYFQKVCTVHFLKIHQTLKPKIPKSLIPISSVKICKYNFWNLFPRDIWCCLFPSVLVNVLELQIWRGCCGAIKSTLFLFYKNTTVVLCATYYRQYKSARLSNLTEIRYLVQIVNYSHSLLSCLIQNPSPWKPALLYHVSK